MKKFVLSLGSVAAVVAPVASVISCGDDEADKPNIIVDTVMVILDKTFTIGDKTNLTVTEKEKLATEAAKKILLLDASEKSKIKKVSISFKNGTDTEIIVTTLASADAPNAASMNEAAWVTAIKTQMPNSVSSI